MNILNISDWTTTEKWEAIGGLLGGIGVIVFLIIKVAQNFPRWWKIHIRRLFGKSQMNHSEAVSYRKKIMPKINKILCDLAEEVDGDRALLFEYTNGNTNLVGLPFLYASATAEVLKPGISSVINGYQRINIMIATEFINNLDAYGYVYWRDIEDIKGVYPVIYKLMKPNQVVSALFYSIYSDMDPIGFIVVTTIKKQFEKEGTLPTVAAVSQAISGLLNYDRLKKMIEMNVK